MKLGIVGLPNVGKSTLFNAITGAGIPSANYPFCTIDPNVGMVPVPDERMDRLSDMYDPDKYTPAVIEFLDIAGLVKGAASGEGLGNKFLSHIRQVDAIIHVVRCFEDTNIIHVDGDINPERDIDTINYELVLSDIEMLDRRIDKQKKQSKGDKSLLVEVDLLERLRTFMEDGKTARQFDFAEGELELASEVSLLTLKPVIYAANLSESDLAENLDTNPRFVKLKEIAEIEGASVLPICARIEEELSQMEPEDKAMFLEDLGIEESGLNRLIKESYALLGLISYLTAGKQEVRAWTITKGTKAPQAAGKIHSDFERGFIRAEIVAFTDLMECGSMVAAKEKGLVRSEGKEYVINDGDVVLFRFNV